MSEFAIARSSDSVDLLFVSYDRMVRAEGELAAEIEASLTMLKGIGVDVAKGWTMAYPYGDRNAVSHDVLRAAGCSAAFTTEHRVAVPALDDVFDLPRLDTVSIYP